MTHNKKLQKKKKKKKKEILSFVTIWMNLGNVMLNEISQVQKDMYHMISHTCGTYKCPIKSKTGLCSISATARRLLGGPGPRAGDIAAAAAAR
jgi:hypothetical protein